MELKSGVLIPELPYEQYAQFALDKKALRSSMLRPLMKSPRFLRWQMDNPKEASPAQELGILIHKYFENPEKFLDMMVIEPEFTGRTKDGKESSRSKEARDAREAWRAENSSKMILNSEQRETVLGIRKTVLSRPKLMAILKDGVSETSLQVDDPKTGATLACRPDFISSVGHVIDIKSSRDASPQFFRNQIFSDSRMSPFYLLFAAHYAYCMKIAKIGSGEFFTFIVPETCPPYDIMVYPLDQGQLASGEEKRAELTALYKKCLDANDWPGYPDKSFAVETPSYVKDSYYGYEEEEYDGEQEDN